MSAETLIRHAHKLLANCDIPMSSSKVSRLVRTFKARVEQNGYTFEAFLVNAVEVTAQQRRQMLANPDIARVISYADPTGEAAVNNIIRNRTSAPTAVVVQDKVVASDLVPDINELHDIYAMADLSVSDEQFEEILAEARSEGDLSRENIVRKCKALEHQ